MDHGFGVPRMESAGDWSQLTRVLGEANRMAHGQAKAGKLGGTGPGFAGAAGCGAGELRRQWFLAMRLALTARR